MFAYVTWQIYFFMFACTDDVTMTFYVQESKEGSVAGARVAVSAHGEEASYETGEIYGVATCGKDVIVDKKMEFKIYPTNSRSNDEIFKFPLELDPAIQVENIVFAFVIKSTVTNDYAGQQFGLKWL